VKEFWKSVKIWRNYRQKKARFGDTVYCVFFVHGYLGRSYKRSIRLTPYTFLPFRAFSVCIVLYVANKTELNWRCELRWRISHRLDMLQDSQRASSLVHSGQEMSVLQRQFGRLWRWRSTILSQFSAVGKCMDWTDKVVVDMDRFMSAKH